MISTDNYDADERKVIESVLQRHPEINATDSEYVNFHGGNKVELDGYFTLTDLKIFCEILEALQKEESHDFRIKSQR